MPPLTDIGACVPSQTVNSPLTESNLAATARHYVGAAVELSTLTLSLVKCSAS